MEKIQHAIAKARAAREGLPPVVAAPAASVEAPVSVPDVAAAWAALTPLTLKARAMARARIVAFAGGREAVPFDVMRTKLLQQMRANNWRRLAITSPTAACGKSMITVNLALSLARQPELRTLVAELDLRRPSLARTLGIATPQNFANVLEGSSRFEDNARCFGGNLALATNQTAWRNPAELLHSSSVPAALADIETRYAPDLVIFDMPPMLVSDDTMAFMSQVDCVLLVAAAEASTIKEIDTCERELASQTNVMGVVLNKCRFMGPDYGYSYYG